MLYLAQSIHALLPTHFNGKAAALQGSREEKKTYCARPSDTPAPSDQKTNTYPLPPSPPPSASLPSTFLALSLSAPSFGAHYRA